MKTPPLLLPFLALLLLHLSAHGQGVPELLAEGQRAYQQNNFPEAREKFQFVLELDPKNKIATNYLKLVNNVLLKQGGGNLRQTLEQTLLEKVVFKEATLAEALDFVRQKASQKNPGRQINLVLNLDDATKAMPISLTLQNVPTTEVLRYIGELASVQFSYEKFAVVVKPRGTGAAPVPKSSTPDSGVKIDGL